MGKSANLGTLNQNMTKRVFSGSVQAAGQGVKYDASQTKTLYKKFLIALLLKPGAAAASLVVKKLAW